VVAPERFVAYLFDDVHLVLATWLACGTPPTVTWLPPTHGSGRGYAMSGEVSLDFTDDRTKLHDALLRLRPGVMVRAGALTDLEQRTLASLANLKELIKRMAIAPGQRTIMFISPGFNTFAAEYIQEETDILERAIKANVIISTLDARGLYTDPSMMPAAEADRSARPFPAPIFWRNWPPAPAVRSSRTATIWMKASAGWRPRRNMSICWASLRRT